MKHFLLSLSVLMMTFAPYATLSARDDRPQNEIKKEHSRLLKKTQKQTAKCLAAKKCSEKKQMKIWSKWALQFDLPLHDYPGIEQMASPQFAIWTWAKIEEQALSVGGFDAYQKKLKTIQKKLFWCHLKKVSLYSLTGLLYAGSIVALTTLIVVPGTFLFSIWGLVWLAVPAGANWGTLTLLEAMEGCKLQ